MPTPITPLILSELALGVFHFVKGVEFMSNHEQMSAMARPFQDIPGGMIILHYIAPAHFVGGFLLVVGLLTRWVALAQLPILIGAVLTNFLGQMNSTNLVLSLVALLACLFFMVYGSGKHSADYYLKMQQ